MEPLTQLSQQDQFDDSSDWDMVKPKTTKPPSTPFSARRERKTVAKNVNSNKTPASKNKNVSVTPKPKLRKMPPLIHM